MDRQPIEEALLGQEDEAAHGERRSPGVKVQHDRPARRLDGGAVAKVEVEQIDARRVGVLRARLRRRRRNLAPARDLLGRIDRSLDLAGDGRGRRWRRRSRTGSRTAPPGRRRRRSGPATRRRSGRRRRSRRRPRAPRRAAASPEPLLLPPGGELRELPVARALVGHRRERVLHRPSGSRLAASPTPARPGCRSRSRAGVPRRTRRITVTRIAAPATITSPRPGTMTGMTARSAFVIRASSAKTRSASRSESQVRWIRSGS